MAKSMAKPVKPAKSQKVPFYTSLKPMLATLVDKPFDQEGWLYEIKWDGYRAVAFMNKKMIELKLSASLKSVRLRSIGS